MLEDKARAILHQFSHTVITSTELIRLDHDYGIFCLSINICLIFSTCQIDLQWFYFFFISQGFRYQKKILRKVSLLSIFSLLKFFQHFSFCFVYNTVYNDWPFPPLHCPFVNWFSWRKILPTVPRRMEDHTMHRIIINLNETRILGGLCCMLVVWNYQNFL
jgi:hypothetical protein